MNLEDSGKASEDSCIRGLHEGGTIQGYIYIYVTFIGKMAHPQKFGVE